MFGDLGSRDFRFKDVKPVCQLCEVFLKFWFGHWFVCVGRIARSSTNSIAPGNVPKLQPRQKTISSQSYPRPGRHLTKGSSKSALGQHVPKSDASATSAIASNIGGARRMPIQPSLHPKGKRWRREAAGFICNRHRIVLNRGQPCMPIRCHQRSQMRCLSISFMAEIRASSPAAVASWLPSVPRSGRRGSRIFCVLVPSTLPARAGVPGASYSRRCLSSSSRLFASKAALRSCR
jgi:hypothetical protein